MKKDVEDKGRKMLGQFLGTLMGIGNRAVGAALKSATKDVRHAAREVDRKAKEMIDRIDEIAPPTAEEGDERITVEGEGISTKKRRAPKKR